MRRDGQNAVIVRYRDARANDRFAIAQLADSCRCSSVVPLLIRDGPCRYLMILTSVRFLHTVYLGFVHASDVDSLMLIGSSSSNFPVVIFADSQSR